MDNTQHPLTIGELEQLVAAIPPAIPRDTPVKIEADKYGITLRDVYDILKITRISRQEATASVS